MACDCYHLGCSDAPDCFGQCGQGARDAYAKNCTGTTLTTSQILHPSTSQISPADATANKSQPFFDFNPTDNLPGGPNDQLNAIGSGITNLFGGLGKPCSLGGVTLPFPCALLFGGVALVVVLVLVLKIK
jgi:hypothetical protein